MSIPEAELSLMVLKLRLYEEAMSAIFYALGPLEIAAPEVSAAYQQIGKLLAKYRRNANAK